MGQHTFSAKTEARAHFARQLRQFRVARGHRTARSLAKVLGIGENRYTRYERAEVEPDLALLQQVCQVATVTPAQLLLPDKQTTRRNTLPNGSVGLEGAALHPGRDASLRTAVEALTWRLASAVITCRNRADEPPVGAVLPQVQLQETTALYRQLSEQPFDAINTIVSDPAIALAPTTAAQTIHELIDRLAAVLTGASED